jgi:hypothetical protein
MDSSFQLQWGQTSIVIDPWLVGSEIDGHRWLNEQWHITAPVPVAEIELSHLLISQPYSDHCHKATISELQYDQVIGVKPALKRLKRELNIPDIKEIPDVLQGWLALEGLKIAKLSPNRMIDPIYHAIIIAQGDEAIFYAPHGFELLPAQLAAIKHLSIKLLITTYTYFKIPALLGGLVNTGIEGVEKLAGQLQPTQIINAHDEQKKGRGLIIKLAKTKYEDMNHHATLDPRIVVMEDYYWREF